MKTSPILPTKTARWLCATVGLTVVLASVTDAAQPRSASAAAGDGIAAYISAPFVQGPPSSVSATVETFDSWSSCSSFPASGVGVFSGSCDVHDGTSYEWGGAQTSSDTPTVQPGGTPTKFVSGPDPAGGVSALTLTFSSPAKYVGFWWSAGSPSDEVKFYDSSNTLIAAFTTATLSTRLGSSIPTSNPFPGPETLTAQNGTAYKRDYYWGRPYAYSTTTPTAIAYGGNVNRNAYAHAYLNVHASGSIAFSKIEFVGNPFEFDNVAVSTSARTPDPSTVFIESVLGKSVDFRANGGTGSMATQTSNAATTLTPNSFTRAGHNFAGWSTSPTGTVAYADGDNYSFAADTTLHALWTPIPYTVEYDTQGGSAVADDSYTIGSSVTLPNTPTWDGYTFVGWFTSDTGGTALGATYSPPSTGPITLYAQWTPNSYDIVFDSQGGSAVPNGSFDFGSNVTLPTTPPTRDGYSFAGWFLAASGGTAIDATHTPSTASNLTLFAQWTRAEQPSTTTTPTTSPTTTTPSPTVTSPTSTSAPTVAANSEAPSPVARTKSANTAKLPKTGQRPDTTLAFAVIVVALGLATLRLRRKHS